MPTRTSGFLKAMFVAATIVAASLLAACGTSSPTPTASVPTAAPPASGQVEVVISNFTFSPATITVPAGTTVTWTNKDSVAHNVVSDDGALFDSGILRQSATYSYTFTRSGVVPFHCAPHPSMKGTIFVQ